MAASSATLSRRSLIAIIWIPVLTFGAILTIPAFLGVLRDHYGMSDGTARVDRVSTATAAGLKVIAVASTQKLAFARSRGAVETIDYKTESRDQRQRMMRLS